MDNVSLTPLSCCTFNKHLLEKNLLTIICFIEFALVLKEIPNNIPMFVTFEQSPILLS